MKPAYVIVGASLAGATAAVTLRQEGFDGDLALIGAESEPPYERPPLSKEYLRGEVAFEKSLVRPVSFYEDNAIRTQFGVRALRVDPVDQLVHLDTGQSVPYDKLLIATGARNRRPPIPGRDLAGVYDLRSVSDANALRAAMLPGRRAVVIGMGFIGSEVAASLSRARIDVTAIDPSPAPLFRVLGAEVANVLADIHREHGVHSVFEDVVTRFEGVRHVKRVMTKTGRRIDCDFAVIGVGVEPVVDLVTGTTIETDNGILVDEYCAAPRPRVRSGRCRQSLSPRVSSRMRVEHWQNSMQQGAAAARNMMGRRTSYDAIHWFWSDQYDVNLQYAGFPSGDRIAVSAAVSQRDFIAFYLNDGRIDAAVAVESRQGAASCHAPDQEPANHRPHAARKRRRRSPRAAAKQGWLA